MFTMQNCFYNFFYKFFKCISIFLLSFSCFVSAEYFKTPYVSFNIGKNWTCKSFGIDWACHKQLSKGIRPALILVTAKASPSSDNFDLYTKSFQFTQAENIKIHKRYLNRHLWFEDFNQRDFYNNIGRQLGTVCCKHTDEKIRVFVGFYANQENFSKYANTFLKATKTLKLTSNVKQTLQSMKGLSTDRQEMLSYVENILFEADEEAILFNQAKNTKPNLVWIILAGLILASLFFSLLYLKKKKTSKIYRNTRRKRRR